MAELSAGDEAILDEVIERARIESERKGIRITDDDVKKAKAAAASAKGYMGSQDIKNVEHAVVLPVIRGVWRGLIAAGCAPEFEKASMRKYVVDISPIGENETVGTEVKTRGLPIKYIMFGECAADHDFDAELKKLERYAPTKDKVAQLTAQISKIIQMAARYYVEFYQKHEAFVKRMMAYLPLLTAEEKDVSRLTQSVKNHTLFLAPAPNARVGIFVRDDPRGAPVAPTIAASPGSAPTAPGGAGPTISAGGAGPTVAAGGTSPTVAAVPGGAPGAPGGAPAAPGGAAAEAPAAPGGAPGGASGGAAAEAPAEAAAEAAEPEAQAIA